MSHFEKNRDADSLILNWQDQFKIKKIKKKIISIINKIEFILFCIVKNNFILCIFPRKQ